MISWWLILIAIIAAILVLGLVIYLLVLFQAEEDRTQAWFPKIVVVLGLSLACFNVLLLPYDVANRQNTQVIYNTGGGIDTVLMWQIVMYLIACFTFFIVPFAMMYYEAQDPEQKSIFDQIKPALIYTIIFVVIFAILLFSMWLTIGTAVIPYTKYVAMPQMHNPPIIMNFTSNTSSDSLEVKVSFFVYLVALLAAVGWLIFFVFGGVGLVAFPMDFIRNFFDRPKPITAAEYSQKRVEIAKESERLIQLGQKLDALSIDSPGRKHKRDVAAFKRQVADLEHYYEKLEISYKEKGGQLMKAIMQLILGIIGGVLSIMWILHIILYDAAKVTPFLNKMFIDLDDAFSLFGLIAYSIFAFYLLWCVIKGCTKIGVNLLIFTVYPMELNKTLMNAFCFNTMLILLTSITVVQFCTISFDIYAVNTPGNMLFTTYASRLIFIGYILIYFIYPLIVIVVLSLLWLFICPRRKTDVEDID